MRICVVRPSLRLEHCSGTGNTYHSRLTAYPREALYNTSLYYFFSSTIAVVIADLPQERKKKKTYPSYLFPIDAHAEKYLKPWQLC